jgi:phosphoenolpyruvate carboxykinase (ATP)
MDRRSLRSREGISWFIQRISIQATRNIINAIHDGSLLNAKYETLPIFNLSFPTSIHDVDTKILDPRNSWSNKEEYNLYAKKVAEMFNQNFERFANDASAAVKAGAPVL